MKKLATLLCSVALLLLAAVPVLAAEGGASVTITGGGADESEAVVVGASGQEPVSVKLETIGDVPYITKIFELPPGADTSGLAASFEQDGFQFSLHDRLEQQAQGLAKSKTVTQTKTLETESNIIADIVAASPPVMQYDEDGFSGELSLDAKSIVVEEKGATSYRYRVTDVREYDNLDRNDAAYVPKTVQKNGATLELESIEWVVMGQHPVDGRLVPNLFKAIATYSGTATGSKSNGYTATLTYTGTVAQASPGQCVVTLVFRGEPLAAASSEAEAAPPNADKNSTGRTLFFTVLIILLSAACLAVAGIRIAEYIRNRRGGTGEDCGEEWEEYEEYGESDPAQPPLDDTRHFVQPPPSEPPQQHYPADEYYIDDLFNEEGFFNE